MKINITLKVFIIITLVFYSCQHKIKETKCHYNEFINVYVGENFDSDISIINSDYIFFANMESDSVLITDNISLFEIYKSQYFEKFSDFKIFLCLLYEDKILLKKNDIDNNIEKINKVIFKKDSTLIDSLSYENIDKIINYYFTDDDYFRTTLKITQNQKYNILFFFFKNEYYISSSDYDGSFSIIKK